MLDLYLSVILSSQSHADMLCIFLSENSIHYDKVSGEDLEFAIDIIPACASELYAVSAFLHNLLPGGVSE